MKNLNILTDALGYIESNLCNEISQNDIAKNCYCSLSNLQKLFRYVFHESVGEYVAKRRLTSAARDLHNTDMTVLEVAVKYCYNSAEVFTRAFTKLWHITPSRFRKEWSFSGIYPKFDFEFDEGANIMPIKKKYDISELYDYLKSNVNTYVLSFDMVQLMPINENYGHEAGDKAILESLRRIDENCGENMLMFRIGGDEFVLVSGYENRDDVAELASKILAHNGETISHNGIDIPVSLRVGAMKIKGKNVRYGELFTKLVELSAHNDVNIDGIKCYFAD